MSTHIFVFGSNEHGRHGRGAALCARREHGAIYGQGFGLQGQSFAIPTKGQSDTRRLYTLPLAAIEAYVRRFLAFANEHPEMQFDVTRIGCGLAGYTDSEIAPMFAAAPPNCTLPQEWLPFTRPNTPPAEAPTSTLAGMTIGQLLRNE